MSPTTNQSRRLPELHEDLSGQNLDLESALRSTSPTVRQLAELTRHRRVLRNITPLFSTLPLARARNQRAPSSRLEWTDRGHS